MIKLLTVGFYQEDIPTSTNDMILAQHSPGIPTGMSPVEYYMKCKEMATDATAIIVKSNNSNFSEDEVIVLDTAYSNKTPIFYVGVSGTESILQFMFTNWFSTVEDVIDHIQVFY